jgi:transposase-like protein
MTSYDLTARRRYSREEKAAIVAEAVRENSVSAVARRHRIAAALLFRWKKEFAPAENDALAAAEPAQAAKFVPAVIAPRSGASTKRERPRGASPEDPQRAVEIAFPDGCVLRVPKDIEEAALARLIRRLRA